MRIVVYLKHLPEILSLRILLLVFYPPGLRLMFEFPLLQSRNTFLMKEVWIETYPKLFFDFPGPCLVSFLLALRFLLPLFLL